MGFLLMSGAAHALQFDLDGGSASGNIITFDKLEWSAGSSLIDDGIPVSSAAGFSDFTLYTHATLGSFSQDGTNVNLPSSFSLDTTFEITLVAGFGETVTGTDGTNTNFAWDSTNGVNFVEIYIDDTPNADTSLDNDSSGSVSAGTGHSDGTLILRADVSFASGVFSLDTRDPLPLDSHDKDALGGLNTVMGGGNTTIEADVIYYNPNYFLDDITLATFDLFDTTNAATPFRALDPANNYWVSNDNGIAGSGTYISGISETTEDDTLYPVSGISIGTGNPNNGTLGPDMLIQTDASTTFNADITVIPEPGTFFLFGLGMLGCAGFARKRRNS